MKALHRIALLLMSATILNLSLVCQSRRHSTVAPPVLKRSYQNIPLSSGVVGPESTAFDCEGNGPYVGVSDGRILKWQPTSKNSSEFPNWAEFAHTSPYWTTRCSDSYNENEKVCGRPLGLKFDKKTCQLYVADAYYGLMVVGRHGGRARSLANNANGIPFQFTNALDIDHKARVIYFTDSSTRFQRWEFASIISTKDKTGRLMKYDMRTQSLQLLLTNLSFANGVALSKNRDFVLVTETTIGLVRRFWLTGPKTGSSDVFIQLEACPDNINRNEDGDFWIAQVSPKIFSLPPFSGSGDGGLPVKVSEDGVVLEVLDDTRKDNTITTSDVKEFGGRLWIGSVVDDFLEVTNH